VIREHDLYHNIKIKGFSKKVAIRQFKEFFGRQPTISDEKILKRMEIDGDRLNIYAQAREIIFNKIIENNINSFFTKNDEEEILKNRKREAVCDLPMLLAKKKAFEYVDTAKTDSEKKNRISEAYEKYLKKFKTPFSYWKSEAVNPCAKKILCDRIDTLCSKTITMKEKVSYIKDHFSKIVLKKLASENVKAKIYKSLGIDDPFEREKLINAYILSEAKKMNIVIHDKKYFKNIHELIYFIPEFSLARKFMRDNENRK